MLLEYELGASGPKIVMPPSPQQTPHYYQFQNNCDARL